MSEAINAPKVKLVPWWLVLIEGILLIIIGIFLLTQPISTWTAIVWVIGLYWFISGIFNIIKIFFDSSMWGWKIFAGIVGIIAGYFLITTPFGGALVFTATVVLMLGLFGIFIGIVNLIQAFKGGGWGTGILGVISIILGILILSNQQAFILSLPWAVGILMVIGGIIAIFNAFRIRSAKKDLEQAAAAVSAKTSAMADSAASGTAAVGAAAAAAAVASKEKAADVADAAGDAVSDAADSAGDAAAATAAAAADAVGSVSDAADDAGDAVRSAGIDLDLDADGDPAADVKGKAAVLVAAVRSLDPADAEKLVQAGIANAGTLLERGASRPGRAQISIETGVAEPVVLKWVNDLDLARVKGVGVKYSDLLENAGVDTVVELAQRNAGNLYAKLVEVNDKLGLVDELPSEAEITKWVEEAKELPRVITY